MSFRRRGEGSRFGQRDTRCARDRNGVRNPIVRAPETERRRSRAPCETRHEMGYMLEARSLRKRFKDVEAVRDIDITVAPGERVGLLGPNGAGKTTTLLMLLGAITPDHGEITIGGHALPRHRSRAMEAVGFAAGYLPLPDRLKVSEALGVFAGWYGVRDHRAAVAPGARAVRDRPPRRPALLGAVLRPAHTRRHRQGDPARPGAARARRADRIARPRRGAEGPLGAAHVLCHERRRAARDQPRHARGRDAHGAGDLRRPRRGGRQRHARRGRGRSTATPTSNRSSCPSPPSTDTTSDELAPHPHRHPPARLRALARARTGGSTSRSGR